MPLPGATSAHKWAQSIESICAAHRGFEMMAKGQIERGVPDDAPMTYKKSVDRLKAALQRDLEWLLNTRRIALELPESAEELRRSLFYYGLPEFAGRNIGRAD